MIDHIGIAVSNYARSRAFYSQALAPLDYALLIEVDGFAGFGSTNGSGAIASFWIHEEANQVMKGMHIAFSASTRKKVDAFYEAAIRIGATDNGKPGIRAIYHPNYYGAFVLDPDGYNMEAVCHLP